MATLTSFDRGFYGDIGFRMGLGVLGHNSLRCLGVASKCSSLSGRPGMGSGIRSWDSRLEVFGRPGVLGRAQSCLGLEQRRGLRSLERRERRRLQEAVEQKPFSPEEDQVTIGWDSLTTG